MEPQRVDSDLHKCLEIFGKGAERFFSDNTPIDNNSLTSAGLIGAVCDANIAVAEGEIFVIMGLSGSGKSTLLRCLSRLFEPTSGVIMFEGENLLEQSEKKMIQIRRHKMGMVFQHFALMPHLTVLGNVAFPLEVQGVDRSQREKRAREVIELVGLEGREFLLSERTVRRTAATSWNCSLALKWNRKSGFLTSHFPHLIP